MCTECGGWLACLNKWGAPAQEAEAQAGIRKNEFRVAVAATQHTTGHFALRTSYFVLLVL